MPATLTRPTHRHVTGDDVQADLFACALCRTGNLPTIEDHFEPALIELA
ncbi:MAG: hypothetical protein ACOCZK_00925 [Planctomycetota bacterium]